MGFLNGKMGMGLAIGVGAAMVMPMASRAVSGVAKPLMKEGIKGGMLLYEKGRIMMAEARESVEDIAAEAKSERESEKKTAPASKGKAKPEAPRK